VEALRYQASQAEGNCDQCAKGDPEIAVMTVIDLVEPTINPIEAGFNTAESCLSRFGDLLQNGNAGR